MVKFELASCCLSCEYEDIDVQRDGIGVVDKDGKKRTLEPVTHIGCRHRMVCNDYLNEPLQALPLEYLKRSE